MSVKLFSLYRRLSRPLPAVKTKRLASSSTWHGSLTICPTPLGNLSDISLRQKETLLGADVIACEDTRVTKQLLALLRRQEPGSLTGKTPYLISYHDNNELKCSQEVVDLVLSGNRVVLASDAGTPCISDPGYRLVQAAIAKGIPITSLPGPVAAMVALTASGAPTDRFFFEGFPPRQEGKLVTRLRELREMETTVILYESPRRLLGLLIAAEHVYGPNHVVFVGRELTKMYEEHFRGPISDVIGSLKKKEVIKGEVTVILYPDCTVDEADSDSQMVSLSLGLLVRELKASGLREREIKDVLGRVTQVKSRSVADILEKLR
eukprot:GILJ01006472.1.p1 GENE.GILJ01006472.1~~GILJ01006472.1.p1  ORF type:complete len:321 (+),score=10.19 GILJ01006472.1:128-1090(+)